MSSGTQPPAQLRATDEQPTCRWCWEPEADEPGGHLSWPCSCTAGVHDSCLLQWLLSESGRDRSTTCSVCTAAWRGPLTVSIQEVAEQAAALKRSLGAPSEQRRQLAATLQQLRERNTLMLQHLAAAEAAERQRQAEFDRMKRIAFYDRQLALQELQQERQLWQRRLRYLPGILMAVLGAFFAGAHWQHHSSSSGSPSAGSGSSMLAAAAVTAAQ